MGYDKEKLFTDALNIIKKDKDVVFIEDVICCMSCSKATFYKYFPEASDELDIIKTRLDENKTNRKKSLRKKWHEGDNATTQITLYKLLATEEEHKRITQNNVDHTTNGDKLESVTVYTLPKKNQENEEKE